MHTAMHEDGILYYNDSYSLDISMPENSNNVPIVIVLPGGAYYKLSTWYEGSGVAMWLNHRGIGAAVLHYRMPNHHPEWPQEDIVRAVAYLRDNAMALHADPQQIGIMGFSAGGHAVAMSLTRGLPVQFAILFYPVISMERSITHMETHNWLLHEDVDVTTEQMWSADLHVHENMPRTLLIACEDDNLVPVTNTKRFYASLNEMHVPCSLHILPFGGHGWGFSLNMPNRNQVELLLAQFLNCE